VGGGLDGLGWQSIADTPHAGELGSAVGETDPCACWARAPADDGPRVAVVCGHRAWARYRDGAGVLDLSPDRRLRHDRTRAQVADRLVVPPVNADHGEDGNGAGEREGPARYDGGVGLAALLDVLVVAEAVCHDFLNDAHVHAE
jgi:hypothetical protein